MTSMRIGRLTLILALRPAWMTWGTLREAGIHTWEMGCICLEWEYEQG